MFTARSFAAEPLRSDPPAAEQLARRRRILLVEDDALVRMSVRRLCASVFKDVEVLEAGSLAEALSVFERRRDPVDLVLLDLSLPDSKGFAPLVTVKRRFPDSRVVVLSGSFDEAIAVEAGVLGAARFLHRGVDAQVLASTLTEMMEPSLSYRSARARVRRSQPTPAANLSSREIEILNHVLQGKTNEEIVGATGLKLGTIKNYISGLFVVFGVASRPRLVCLFA